MSELFERSKQSNGLDGTVTFPDAAVKLVPRQGEPAAPDSGPRRPFILEVVELGKGWRIERTRFGYNLTREGENVSGTLEERLEKMFKAFKAAEEVK